MVAVLRAILQHAVDVDELLDVNPAAKFGKRYRLRQVDVPDELLARWKEHHA